MFPKFWYARVAISGGDSDSFVWFCRKYARSWDHAQQYMNENIVSELGYGWSCNFVQITEDKFLEGCRKSAFEIDELIRICNGEIVEAKNVDV